MNHHIEIIPQTTHDQAGNLVRTYAVKINGVPRYVIREDE